MEARERPPRRSWIRAAPRLAGPIARTMPWPTLITGCLAGTIMLAVVTLIARGSHWPLAQGAVWLTFAPAIAALAFVPRAWFRPLAQSTPVPAWLGPAGHILLAVPVLAVTCWAQLRIMTSTSPAGHLSGAHPAAVYPLLAQLTGFCLVTVAAAACVDRTRYADLGGAIAAPVSLVAIAAAWYVPVVSRVLFHPPASARGVTTAWYLIAAAALALTAAALRDQWHRYSRRPAAASRTLACR
jgi:hypothetical protein